MKVVGGKHDPACTYRLYTSVTVSVGFILPRGAQGKRYNKRLDHSCNKYYNLIGYRQVSIYHSHLQVLPPGSSNTRLYDLKLLDTV